MTVIRLDTAAAEQVRAAEGRVVLADEHGNPIRLCVLPPVPMSEPELPPEEWDRRAREPGGIATAHMLEYLQNLDRS